jgi:hypothetical protein
MECAPISPEVKGPHARANSPERGHHAHAVARSVRLSISFPGHMPSSEQPSQPAEPRLGTTHQPGSASSASTASRQSAAGASRLSGNDAEQRLAVLVAEVEQLAPQLSQATLRAAAERIQALVTAPSAQQDASPAQPMQLSYTNVDGVVMLPDSAETDAMDVALDKVMTIVYQNNTAALFEGRLDLTKLNFKSNIGVVLGALLKAPHAGTASPASTILLPRIRKRTRDGQSLFKLKRCWHCEPLFNCSHYVGHRDAPNADAGDESSDA